MTYGRLDGWYVLTAELLGTIILIALCVVAASQVCEGAATATAAAGDLHLQHLPAMGVA
jgi:cell division septation protein DedD